MDDEQLETELSFSRRRDWRGRKIRPPPGANAITAIAIVLTLLAWGVTVPLIQSLGIEKGSGVVDPGSCLMLVVFGVEGFFCSGLAGGVWRAIGPAPRTLLRGIFVLGVWPGLLIGGFGFAMIVSFTYGAATGKLGPPKTAGTNWRLMEISEKQGVTYDVAMSRCVQFGDEWKVPTREELARFAPPFEARKGLPFWLDGLEDNMRFQTSRECRGFDCESKIFHVVADTQTAFVVCFKGP